jgi:tetratricopeptide (TPR) repeat protein
MQKSCPSCGAEIFPGARFCRRCGVALRLPGDGTGDVSPQAATVPLDADASRATDGLPPTEEKTDSAKTSRVSREEMERILRAAQEADQRKLSDPNATVANLRLDTLPPEQPSGDARRRDPEAPPDGNPATGHIEPKARDTEDELTLNVPRPTRSLDAREPSDFDPTNPALVTRETTTFDHSDALAASSDQPNTQAASLDQSDSSGLSDSSDSQTASHESAPHEAANYESSQFEAREYKLAELQPDAQPSTSQQQAQQGQARTRQARGAQAAAARPRRRWPYVVAAACVIVLAFTVAAAFLAFKFLRRPQLAALPTPLPTASPSAADAGEFEQKLSEAEALLAQGDLDAAIARLREANALDPSNTRAHRRLGELLLASGARRDAIEEFRAVTRNAPDDFTAWRQLATAQFAEGLYRDAADSYRHLISLVGDQAAEPSDLLSYADALRLSGRPDDARAIYQRLASSPSEDVASTARQRLAELAQAAQTQHPGEQQEQQTPRGDETASLTQPVSQPTPALTPTPAPRPTPTPTPARPSASTPAEHYQRGVELWSSNRGAAFQEFQAAASGGNVDANYYLGLSYVEGRDIHSLNRASLIAALRYFQLAQRPGGQHVSESRRYEQELGKEFDRMRKP